MQESIASFSHSLSILFIVFLIIRFLKSLQVAVCGYIVQICLIIGGFIDSMKLLLLNKKLHQMHKLFNRCNFKQYRRNWFNKSRSVWHCGNYNYCGTTSNYMTGNMDIIMSGIMSGT